MQYKVHFLPADVSVMCDEGKTIMEAERIAGLGFEYPCGGNGTCGKCMVSVFDGKETKVLKSCTTQVCSDITVTFLSETGKHDEKVLTSSGVCGAEQNVCVNSGIKVIKVDVDEAQVGDVIVLAGKGHEDYQIIGKEKFHMDEREIVADFLKKRKTAL